MGREQEVLGSPSKEGDTRQLGEPPMNGTPDHSSSLQEEYQVPLAEEIPAGNDGTHEAGASEVHAEHLSADADVPAAAANGEPTKKKAVKSPGEEVQVGIRLLAHWPSLGPCLAWHA